MSLGPDKARERIAAYAAEATRCRQEAERTRALIAGTSTDSTRSELLSYAEEMEAKAASLDIQADELRRSLARREG